MSRIRNVKPEFFRHEGLQDLEIKNPGKYPMFVFEGLWTKCDRNGVFEWKPRSLKLDILPFLNFDMEETLKILETEGYVKRYCVDGKEYGIVPTFLKHQKPSIAEQKNLAILPLPHEEEKTVSKRFQNGSETVSKPFQNTGVRSTENGVRKTENGNTDPPENANACDFSDPKKLFLHIWQTTPGNVFNSLARIEKPNDFAAFWAGKFTTAPPDCAEIKRVMQNVIDDVQSGALERRYIPKTPDRFVLGGGFTRHQTRFRQEKSGKPPPPNLAGKKSLGGLEK
jgi:hypothetical protein